MHPHQPPAPELNPVRIHRSLSCASAYMQPTRAEKSFCATTVGNKTSLRLAPSTLHARFPPQTTSSSGPGSQATKYSISLHSKPALFV